MGKDINRFSFSRLKTFQTCPRKHHYNYIEQIETEETATTIPGKLFHQCLENYHTGVSPEPVFQEFRDMCASGKLDLDKDLLEYVFKEYLKYYNKELANERAVIVEHEFKDNLEGDDYLVAIVDEAFYELDTNMLILRDRKTTLNKLKYTYEDVNYNAQLYLYLPYVEDALAHSVDAIEIDEIRLAKLQPVPLRKSGTPSTSKNLLDLVTYEDYYNVLAERGIELESEYQPILDYLEKRGHPLFNRIRVQVLDKNISNSIARDLYNTYKISKLDPTYRVKGPLCHYCSYKSLCELDYSDPMFEDRKILIEKIGKK